MLPVHVGTPGTNGDASCQDALSSCQALLLHVSSLAALPGDDELA